MKAILVNAVVSCLTLFISASVQGSYTYTTLDVPGASTTLTYGIDDDNIVGYYSDASGAHGFLATILVPLPAAVWMALRSGPKNWGQSAAGPIRYHIITHGD